MAVEAMDAPGSPLVGRYQYVGEFDAPRTGMRWVALDTRTGKAVVVAHVGRLQVARLDAIRDQKHPHLATVLEVISAPATDQLPGGQPLPAGDAVAVAELIQGQTLCQALVESGPLLPFKAVAWLLRLVSAVAFLHRNGVTHGAISPWSVVAAPKGRVIAPVLGHFVAPALGGYVTPERLRGAPAAPEDDLWGLFTTFYAMLTGVSPFRGNSPERLVDYVLAGSAHPLSHFGVHEPLLQDLLTRGLQPTSRQRVVDLVHVERVLDAWERGVAAPPAPVQLVVPRKVPAPGQAAVAPTDVVYDEISLPDDNGVPPTTELSGLTIAGERAAAPSRPDSAPELVGAAPVAIPTAVSAAASGPAGVVAAHTGAGSQGAGRRWWPLALVGGLLASGAGATYLLLPRDDEAASSPQATALRPAPTDFHEEEGARALRRELMSPDELRDECIRAYFPKEAFPDRKPLGFVCGDDSFVAVVRHLYTLADPGAETDADSGEPAATSDTGSAPTSAPALEGGGLVIRAPSRRLLAALGWYELLTTAIVRSACCPQASLVKLPTSRGDCMQLQGIVREIADASRKGVDVSHATKDFDEAIECLLSSGKKESYPYERPPSDADRHAFQKFLQRAVELDAKRTTHHR